MATFSESDTLVDLELANQPQAAVPGDLILQLPSLEWRERGLDSRCVGLAASPASSNCPTVTIRVEKNVGSISDALYSFSEVSDFHRQKRENMSKRTRLLTWVCLTIVDAVREY